MSRLNPSPTTPAGPRVRQCVKFPHNISHRVSTVSLVGFLECAGDQMTIRKMDTTPTSSFALPVPHASLVSPLPNATNSRTGYRLRSK